jgi:outer membrane lipopolysaccharide assembly protein LptE/RlpB
MTKSTSRIDRRPSSAIRGPRATPLNLLGAPPSVFEGGSSVVVHLYTSWLSRLVLLTSLALSGCGYHVAGRNDALPKSIHTIAVPALENATTSYRLEQRFTAATVHELLAKTPYKVVSTPAVGDAVLRGKILTLEALPLLFDTTTGRSTTMLVTVKCEISLTESDNDKVLYHTDNFVFRSEYEVSTNVTSFFEEQDPALDRLARDFATRLVAAVTENY